MEYTAGEDAILENAERLVNDAQLLFDNGRFPTSASLAILSIEELGKAVHGMSVGHLEKQKAAASFGMIGYLVEHLKKHGLGIKRIENMSEDDRVIVENPNFQTFLRRVVSEALGDSDWSKLYKDATSKELSTIKNRGFYVDIDPQGKVLSVPNEIDSMVAGRLVEIARNLLHTYQSANKSPDWPIVTP